MILTVCANPSVDSFWSVDHISQGTTNRSGKEVYYPGGKGIHTAFALNELGEDISTLGFWGGQTGRWLQDQCSAKGIEITGPAVDTWNRICITLQTDSKWNETELLGHGPEASTAQAAEFEEAYERVLATGDPEAVVISGSAPGGFDDDLYARMIKKAKENETPAFIDASGSLLEKSLMAGPHGIHINHKEGRELSGMQDPAEIARWLADYCTIAALTAGVEGLYLVYKDDLFHASHQIAEKDIVSTIGAGDCLLAGLALATRRVQDPEYWARLAVACGSANCIHPQLGMLKAEDVNEILEQVSLEKL